MYKSYDAFYSSVPVNNTRTLKVKKLKGIQP